MPRFFCSFLLLIHWFAAENITSLSATAGFGPAEAKALEALKIFGFDPAKPREKRKKGLLEALGVAGAHVERAQYELSRYVPPLKDLLKGLAGNTLDKELFPYLAPGEEVTDKPGAGGGAGGVGGKKAASLVPQAWTGNDNNAAASAATAASSSAGAAAASSSAALSDSTTRDVIVFIIGGVAYSECRVAYECAAELGRPFFVGSTAVFQPQEFVRQLQHLSNSVAPVVPRLERLANKNKIEHHG